MDELLYEPEELDSSEPIGFTIMDHWDSKEIERLLDVRRLFSEEDSPYGGLL